MQTTTGLPKIAVTADGAGVVSQAGARLLADLAAVTGLVGGYGDVLVGLRRRLAGHDPGRVLADLAVSIAAGGETISDLAVLRHQPALFGWVASTATAWRVLDSVDETLLDGLRSARAEARERAWAQREEAGRPLPAATAGGRAFWAGDRRRRHAGHRAFGEGVCGADVQWRFRVPSDPGTDTRRGQLAHLEARHRAHARVEDAIRTGKDTGIGRFPSRQVAINAVWLELALAAADLLAWTRMILLDGELARAEPKTLRYRLLHVAARLTRGQRRLFLRIDAYWPWRQALATAVRAAAGPPDTNHLITPPAPKQGPETPTTASATSA